MGESDVEVLRQLLVGGFQRLEQRLDVALERIERHSSAIAIFETRCASHCAEQVRRDARIDAIAKSADNTERSQVALTTRAAGTWRTIVIIAAAVAGIASLLVSIAGKVR